MIVAIDWWAELHSGGPAVMPEDPVSGTKQMRMSSDPGAYPSNCPDACLVRRRQQRSRVAIPSATNRS